MIARLLAAAFFLAALCGRAVPQNLGDFVTLEDQTVIFQQFVAWCRRNLNYTSDPISVGPFCQCVATRQFEQLTALDGYTFYQYGTMDPYRIADLGDKAKVSCAANP